MASHTDPRVSSHDHSFEPFKPSPLTSSIAGTDRDRIPTLNTQAQLLDAEFGAFVQLEFALHTPYVHCMVMATRLLKLVHRSLKSYLGDTMYKEYNQVKQ